MQTHQLLQMLKSQHAELMTFLQKLSDEEIHRQKDGKWSTLQNMDHLLKSAKTVNPAVRKSSLVLRAAFGKPNREARSYEGLVKRYQERLEGVEAEAPKAYRAAESQALDRAKVLKEYDAEMQKFIQYVGKVKERKLDRTLLPHPLLGKLLLREIFYFMHYHTDHHYTAIKKIFMRA